MSQDWTDDVYDKDAYAAHVIMTNVELMFATLKSAFSGTSAPSNAVAGMIWFDTTASAAALKMRNEDNNAWITLLDFENFRIFVDIIAEKTGAAGVTVDSVILKDGSVEVGTGGQVKTGTIVEKVGAAGVTIDGMLVKDGEILSSGLPTDGVTLEKVQHGTIMLPVYMRENEAAITRGGVGNTWESFTEVPPYKIYIPEDATTIQAPIRLQRGSSGSNHIEIRFQLGGLNSSIAESLNVGYQWDYNPTLDVSSLSAGWYDLTFGIRYQGGGTETGYMQGFYLRWE